MHAALPREIGGRVDRMRRSNDGSERPGRQRLGDRRDQRVQLHVAGVRQRLRVWRDRRDARVQLTTPEAMRNAIAISEICKTHSRRGAARHPLQLLH